MGAGRRYLEGLALPLRAWASSAVDARRAAISGPEPESYSTRVDAGAEWFDAWLWDPRFVAHARGFSNVRLAVREGGLTIIPTRLETMVHGWSEPIEYDWPAVVMERLLSGWHRGLLVDVAGDAGLCAAPFATSRLREALQRRGLTVIEVKRWGWGSPRRITAEELGAHAHEVPPSILKRPD